MKLNTVHQMRQNCRAETGKGLGTKQKLLNAQEESIIHHRP